MTTYVFRINGEEIEEPLGFSEFSISVNRDKDTHGVIFEASVGELGFYGRAFEIVKEQKESNGFAGLAVLEIEAHCGVEVDLIKGNLLFAGYRESCGKECIAYLPLEQNDCTLTLRNRYDQKVDLDKATSFDGITLLADYAGLSFPLSLAPQAIDTRAEARVKDLKDIGSFHTIDHPDTDLRSVDIRPVYETTIFDSIDNAEFIPSVAATNPQPDDYGNVSPFLLFDDRVDCFGDLQFDYIFRLKGRVKCDVNCSSFHVTLHLLTWDGTGTWNSSTGFVEYQFNEIVTIPSYVGNTWYEFDVTWTGLIALGPGVGVYPYIRIDVFDAAIPDPTISWEFDPETYGKISKVKLCPPTEADVSLVNETGSRIVEAITDGCVRMKSDYYGRVDSQPYPSTQDGCGSLRVLTSGLKLRRAENPVQFLSLEEFFKDLQAIDNVGWGIEPDVVMGFDRQWVRIEPAEYFYKDELLLEMPAIPDGEFSLDPSLAYSTILVGYERWETQRINGLHEFNSNKVFRTGLKTINNQLEITSGFVASGQAIEVTRQQSSADSGAADTTYDNETFIICVDRDSGDGYIVEQDNIGDPSEIFSPSTAYNWRIRPRYNLMRWWKSIMQSYANQANTSSRLFFGSGTGNLLASGFLDDDCRLDSVARREDEDLIRNDFIVPENPIFKPNKLSFRYPLSLKDYLAIKAKPYGYINAQCGTGDFVKGYIMNLTYSVNNGMAQIVLLLKYDN